MTGSPRASGLLDCAGRSEPVGSQLSFSRRVYVAYDGRATFYSHASNRYLARESNSTSRGKGLHQFGGNRRPVVWPLLFAGRAESRRRL